jgi:hypothetical protein
MAAQPGVWRLVGVRSHPAACLLPCRLRARCYLGNMVTIERVQTGLRIERTTLKVLKGLAEYLDLSLGDLVEGIVWHAFDGTTPFGPPTLAAIGQLKAVYGLTLTAADAHTLKEEQR